MPSVDHRKVTAAKRAVAKKRKQVQKRAAALKKTIERRARALERKVENRAYLLSEDARYLAKKGGGEWHRRMLGTKKQVFNGERHHTAGGWVKADIKRAGGALIYKPLKERLLRRARLVKRQKKLC